MKKHVFVITSVFIALCFATATLYPHWLQRTDAEYPYEGVELMATDAEVHYMARVREIVDGHFTTANVFYHEPKDQPYLLPPIPEAVVALPAMFLNGNPIRFFVLSKGASAFFLTLVLIAFFAFVTKRRWESLLAVTALLFAGALLGAPWDLMRFFTGSLEYDFLRFVRPINPLWSTPWFFAAIGFLACWIERRATWKIVVSSLCTVVTLYSYFYAWSYIGASMALLTAWYAWKRDTVRFKDLMIFLGVFALLGVPYFLNLWETMHHPDYLETSKRLGMAVRRTPVIGWWSIIFLILSFSSRKMWPKTWPLLPMLAIAGILVLNQQVLTARYLVPHHYHWYFVFPLAAVFFMILVLQLASRYLTNRTFTSAISGVLIFIAVYTGFFQQTQAYEAVREHWGARQQWRPVIDALEEFGNAEDVVASSDPRFSALLAAYTPFDFYTADDANHYLVSKQRAEDVLFFRFWLAGITPDEADERFRADLKQQISTYIYAIYYRESAGDYLAIPEDVIDAHADAYGDYFRLSTDEKLSKYPIDLFVILPDDPETSALRDIQERSELLFEQNGYEILRMQ